MSTKVIRRSRIVGCLGVIGLVLAGVGALIAVNWDRVSRRFGAALDAQAERTKVTLFRLGELASIGAELKSAYGVEADVTYSTGTDARILSIALDDHPLPEEVSAEGHAREIAAFAIGKTKKFEQIDVVEVLLRTSAGGLESFRFALAELMPESSGTAATTPSSGERSSCWPSHPSSPRRAIP